MVSVFRKWSVVGSDPLQGSLYPLPCQPLPLCKLHPSPLTEQWHLSDFIGGRFMLFGKTHFLRLQVGIIALGLLTAVSPSTFAQNQGTPQDHSPVPPNSENPM